VQPIDVRLALDAQQNLTVATGIAVALSGGMKTQLALVCCFAAVGCGGTVPPDDESNAAVTVKQGIDYSFARPSPTGIKGAGYQFVARYFDYPAGGGKLLSKGEADSLIAAGLDIIITFEDGAQNALSGYNQGVADAKQAASMVGSVGMPADRPIYFAVDFDATPGDQTPINAYFDGVASVLGINRTGMYGGYWPLSRAFDAGKIKWGWQTYAWSGGMWDTRAQVRQVLNGITVAGDSGCCDQDTSEADDFGQWGHAAPWAAKYVSQSWPLASMALTMKCGDSVAADIVLQNVGSSTWDGNTKLGTTQPRDRSSIFVASDWLAPNRPSHVSGTVGNNGTYKFSFTFHGPTGSACVPGMYHEYFGVVQEGVAWFSDPGQGGPPDNQIEAWINLQAAPPPPPPPPDMAKPADMAGHGGGDAGHNGDAGSVEDGGTTGGSDDAGDTGTGGSVGGGSGGNGGGGPGPNGGTMGSGCSFAGAHTTSPSLVLLGLGFLLAFALRRRSPARR
jgi:hypothetical protein